MRTVPTITVDTRQNWCARVRAVSDRVSREAITDAAGSYDLRDLPPGTYTVTVTPPKGLAFAGPPLPVRNIIRHRDP